VAILPILLYIGMLIGSQAFQETPRSHAPAIVLALVPHLANWGLTIINGSLAAAGTAVAALSHEQMSELIAKMRNEGVLYDGLRVLGGGSILGGLVLGAIAVFIIERMFMKAAGFALAGAVMTFFGFMHGERIGIAETPTVAAAYLVVALIFAGCAKFANVPAKEPEPVEEEHRAGVPA
jgi:AGZA family xanthine/uracil permease-like MFS transporter